MKAATQHSMEQGTSHVLARNPSLSTIHEERTSQMYDTPATERSATVDERAEVSFSFDGKEVSVSLYETPDLTEEEALQVVEMYADQLSEHVSGEFGFTQQFRVLLAYVSIYNVPRWIETPSKAVP